MTMRTGQPLEGPVRIVRVRAAIPPEHPGRCQLIQKEREFSRLKAADPRHPVGLAQAAARCIRVSCEVDIRESLQPTGFPPPWTDGRHAGPSPLHGACRVVAGMRMTWPCVTHASNE